MATIAGTIGSINQVSKAHDGSGTTTRDRMEVWEAAINFAAYTGSTDDASVAAFGAAITAPARDGATGTLVWGATSKTAGDANNQTAGSGGTARAGAAIVTA